MENNPNFKTLYPMDLRIATMPYPEELSLDHWMKDHPYPDLAERYAFTKVREARNARIKKYLNDRGIFESDGPQNGHIRQRFDCHFHAFVPHCEQEFWERISGQTIVYIE